MQRRRRRRMKRRRRRRSCSCSRSSRSRRSRIRSSRVFAARATTFRMRAATQRQVRPTIADVIGLRVKG